MFASADVLNISRYMINNSNLLIYPIFGAVVDWG